LNTRRRIVAIAKPLNIEPLPDLIAKIMNGEFVWFIVDAPRWLLIGKLPVQMGR